VQADREAVREMLAVTGGRRDVPVIVDGAQVQVGYGGT